MISFPFHIPDFVVTSVREEATLVILDAIAQSRMRFALSVISHQHPFTVTTNGLLKTCQ